MKDNAAIRKGCMATFRVVYHQYHARLYSFLLHKTSSVYLSEEVVQLTFIKFWNNRSQLAPDIPLETQLFRIARTTLIDELRRDAVRNNILSKIDFKEATEASGSLDERNSLENIKLLIEELPPMRKTVFKLSRFHHLSNAEIAEMLNITEKTVENHINLALRLLKAHR